MTTCRRCATLKLSTAAGNRAVIDSTGLYCSSAPQIPVNVIDTNSINLTQTGVATVQADLIVSPDAGNAASIRGNGVYVPGTVSPLQAIDTSTIDFTVTGGTIVTGVVRRSPLATNQLVINADGLYVPPAYGSRSFDSGTASASVPIGPYQYKAAGGANLDYTMWNPWPIPMDLMVIFLTSMTGVPGPGGQFRVDNNIYYQGSPFFDQAISAYAVSNTGESIYTRTEAWTTIVGPGGFASFSTRPAVSTGTFNGTITVQDNIRAIMTPRPQ